MKKNSLDTLHAIARVIYDKKGFNILALDVQGLSSITDYLLIAEANVDRHVSSIARAVIEEMRERGEKPLHIEGVQSGDWAVLDFGEVTVHIFSPHLRERYSLERLWGESKIVELELDFSKPAIGENK
ncbi:MAG: ribosome silencing factor [Verrucomicrobia bacterium]|nr:ribosome silencing factor [Verrucomicrobiota bacterium]MBU6447053.1 ribosome silencing factor [Verrucomicrobiota bacterium]MDE3047837.1 ribosome silencing factor [Verrucomicrobiota bacterium]